MRNAGGENIKSIMRGRERRRRRRAALAVSAVVVLVLAAGAWLLFFNKGGPPQAAFEPTATPSVSDVTQTPAPIETPIESVLGETTAEPQVSIDPGDWRLILVNSEHPLPEGFKVTLEDLKNGQKVDERCYQDLQQMIDDCKKAGFEPVICSSYRTQEKQKQLFDAKVKYFKNQGLSQDEAREKAATIIAIPGTSEHQTGLALDIVDKNNQNLDSNQENMPASKWLAENSWKYGFVIRYPATKSDITGITYEPWHYRYVGKEAAKVIHEKGLCLEEYISQIK